MERAADRLYVAVMMERPPASAAYPFWRDLFGEARAPLPALPELTDLLVARGAQPVTEVLQAEPRTLASRDQALSFLRRQTWVEPGGKRDQLLGELLDADMRQDDDGIRLASAEPNPIGIVTWRPSR
jgi:hypothetical protein